MFCCVRAVCRSKTSCDANLHPFFHHRMNQLNLVGNVGKNPDIVSKDKAEFANFSICVNHTEGGKQVADWFNVSVSNQHAVAFVKEHVKQGDMVFVSGQLKIEEYTTAKGEKKSAVKCVIGFEGQVRKLHKADPEAREKRARGGE
jgi:single-stranded DNA-binding protein